MKVLHDGFFKNDMYLESDDGWVAVVVHPRSVAGLVVGENALDAATSVPIGTSSQFPYRVTDGGLHLRTSFNKGMYVKVVYWGEFRPATVVRPVIGSTAKDRDTAFVVPGDGSWYKIEEPSEGQFALTIASDPNNLGTFRVATMDKHGVWLVPGEKIFFPNFNGTVKALYESADGEPSGRIVSVKHENDYNWGYPEDVA